MVNNNVHDKILKMVDGVDLDLELLSQLIVDECIASKNSVSQVSTDCTFDDIAQLKNVIGHIGNILDCAGIIYTISGDNLFNHRLFDVMFNVDNTEYIIGFWDNPSPVRIRHFDLSFTVINDKLTIL